MNQNLHLRSRVVLNLTCLNLTLIHRLRYGLDKRFGSLAVRNLADDKGLIVNLLNLGTNLHDASALSVVILRNIDGTSRQEVGIELERLFVEVTDGGIAYLVEVVWQNLA